MKKLLAIWVFLVGSLALAACGAQTREPSGDGSSGAADRPKTVVVYKDDPDGRSDAEPEEARDDNGPQSTGSQDDGSILVEDDDPDGKDDLDADDNMRSGQQLPADFPIPVPDEYRVGAVGEAGNETAIILRIASGEDAYNYYRQFLAEEGFRVTDEGSNRGGIFDAELEFSNNQLEGNMDFDGETVEVDVERY